MLIIKNKRLFNTSIGMLLGIVMLSPVLQAQDRVLEEVIVTAQRREQSIQEVPVSLEAYSGDLLNQEGFRTMEDLSNFSPSTEINVRTQDQTVTIRGLGTSSVNPGLEQAVPIFVNGVHYGRFPMIQGAMMDLERVEVLRGPQPIAFGQNAVAGAFSLTTRKPGSEIEGDLTAEYGNFGRISFEGGIGGPVVGVFAAAELWLRVGGRFALHLSPLAQLFTARRRRNHDQFDILFTVLIRVSLVFKTTPYADR